MLCRGGWAGDKLHAALSNFSALSSCQDRGGKGYGATQYDRRG